jgi:hypothetical protein
MGAAFRKLLILDFKFIPRRQAIFFHVRNQSGVNRIRQSQLQKAISLAAAGKTLRYPRTTLNSGNGAMARTCRAEKPE